MAAHMFNTSGDSNVIGAKSDSSGKICHRSHGASAHAVNGLARNCAWKPSENAGAAAQSETLVANLGRRGNRNVVDPLRWEVRIATQQFVESADHKVVSAGLCVHPFVAGTSKGSSNCINENYVANRTGHGDLRG
jgi:hypothetical protein